MVLGQPARSVAFVCRCGAPFVRFGPDGPADSDGIACSACGLRYAIRGGNVIELEAPNDAGVARAGREAVP
jgi:DNA-directed RNA polymerase subunit RPC12/RpoP